MEVSSIFRFHGSNVSFPESFVYPRYFPGLSKARVDFSYPTGMVVEDGGSIVGGNPAEMNFQEVGVGGWRINMK